MDAWIMINRNIELKQLALKIYLLDRDQRRYITADMDAMPVEVQKLVDDLDFKFPLLKTLSKSQRQHIFRELMLPVASSGWKLIQEKIDSMKQNDSSYPVKLAAILFE
jgi:hypothetical protein